MDNPGHKIDKQEIQPKPKFPSYTDALKANMQNSSGKQKEHSTPLSKLQSALHELEKKAFPGGIGASQLEATAVHNKQERTSLQVHEIDNNTEKCLYKIKKIQKELMEDIQRAQILQLPVSQAEFVAWKSHAEIYQIYRIPTSQPLSRVLKKIDTQSLHLLNRKTSLSEKKEEIPVNSKIKKTEKQKHIQQITREINDIDKQIETNSKYKKYIEDTLKFKSAWEGNEEAVRELYLMRLKARKTLYTLREIEQELSTQHSSTSQAANLDKYIDFLKQETRKHGSNCIKQREKALSFSRNMEQAYYGANLIFLSSQVHEYTPPIGYQFFTQDDIYSCGPTAVRMILADKNLHFYSDETITEVKNAFSTFHSDGATLTKDIPDVLKKLGHPIPYQYIPDDSYRTIDEILDMPRKNESGTIPLLLGVWPSHDSKFGHLIIIDDVIEKTFEYKGSQYKDRGVGIRNPAYQPYWVCLDDLRDCLYSDVCVPDLT